MSNQLRQLYQAITDILLTVRDPIGVAGIPETLDEYDDYVPEFARALMQGSDQAKLAEIVMDVEQRMAIAPKHSRALEVSRLLMNLRP